MLHLDSAFDVFSSESSRSLSSVASRTQTSSATASEVAYAAAGLLRERKSLPFWLLYDERGSELFERITQQPEYHVTRAERALLERNAGVVAASAARARSALRVVELGAGNARKTDILLRALLEYGLSVDYFPADVSHNALEAASQRLRRRFPEIGVMPMVCTHEECFEELAVMHEEKLVLFLGGSIGNLTPDEARAFLKHLRSVLHVNDQILIGTDLRKDVATLLAAYDDAAGVSAEFALNVLTRLNRDAGANFDPARFGYEVAWNEGTGNIEMYLVSLADQTVAIGALDRTVSLRAGERIQTETSHKFEPREVEALLTETGFEPLRSFRDTTTGYALWLARPDATRTRAVRSY